MSSNGTLLALAVGLGGGALAWHLTRDTKKKKPGTPTTNDASAAPCALRLDAAGLTLDGARIDVAAAVARCKANGRADLVVTKDAPAAALAQLTSALQAAGVTFTQKVA